MNFKVGDEVVVLENHDDGQSNMIGEIRTILKIRYNYGYSGRNVTRIELTEHGAWAEPHEIRLVTKLDKALK